MCVAIRELYLRIVCYLGFCPGLRAAGIGRSGVRKYTMSSDAEYRLADDQHAWPRAWQPASARRAAGQPREGSEPAGSFPVELPSRRWYLEAASQEAGFVDW
jgi:hypothetical protein